LFGTSAAAPVDYDIGDLKLDDESIGKITLNPRNDGGDAKPLVLTPIGATRRDLSNFRDFFSGALAAPRPEGPPSSAAWTRVEGSVRRAAETFGYDDEVSDEITNGLLTKLHKNKIITLEALKSLTEQDLANTKPEPCTVMESKFAIVAANLSASSDLDARIDTEEALEDALKKIHGMKEIKDQLRGIFRVVSMRHWRSELRDEAGKTEIKDTYHPGHFVLMGNPGVGKTMVARILARILFGLGAVESNRFIEVLPSDLVGEYSGQTGPKTRAKLNEARGGVFFLDEAYGLAENKAYGPIAATEINAAMTNDPIVVIVAGYKDRIENEFFPLNSGFQSRFNKPFMLEPYGVEEIAIIFGMKLRSNEMGLLLAGEGGAPPSAEALVSQINIAGNVKAALSPGGHAETSMDVLLHSTSTQLKRMIDGSRALELLEQAQLLAGPLSKCPSNEGGEAASKKTEGEDQEEDEGGVPEELEHVVASVAPLLEHMLTAWQRSTSNGRLAELLLKVARRYQASRLHQCGWGNDQLGGVALTQVEASTMLKRVESLTLTDIAQALEELVQEQKQFDVGDDVEVQDLVDEKGKFHACTCTVVKVNKPQKLIESYDVMYTYQKKSCKSEGVLPQKISSTETVATVTSGAAFGELAKDVAARKKIADYVREIREGLENVSVRLPGALSDSKGFTDASTSIIDCDRKILEQSTMGDVEFSRQMMSLFCAEVMKVSFCLPLHFTRIVLTI
jgi:SpoVK/Ycf46/Vps4 family AAA+-type ATPase